MMIHIIKHKENEFYVKNVILDDGKLSIKFTNKKEKARKFKLYQAAKNVIEAYLTNYYFIETIQEGF